jgi:alkylation response protein AidB-like acyl-CoA dehydrogenase
MSTGEGTAGVDMPASSLALRPVEGIDPDLSLLEVSGRWVSADRASEVLAGDWPSALALGRLAVAHEMVGASRTMLDLACEHARSRIQFGRPIGSFQAIRHRLAETLVGIEMAEAMLDSAWMDGEPGTAAMAKAVAGRQARTAARHCQQVLAGMGFTTEHPLHHYIRRTLVLDGLLGSAPNLTRALGTEVVTSARLPALSQL